MSEAEVQMIRDAWRGFNQGDRGFDPAISHPDLEVHSALAAGSVFRGPAGFEAWLAEIDEQFEIWQLEIIEIHELEPGEYLGHGAVTARGRHSGVDLNQPTSWRISFRDGLIWRLRNFMGPDARTQAQEAAE